MADFSLSFLRFCPIILLVINLNLVLCHRWSNETLALENETLSISEGDLSNPLLFTLEIVNDDGTPLSDTETVEFHVIEGEDYVTVDDNGQVNLTDTPPDYEISTTGTFRFNALVSGSWLTIIEIPYEVVNVNDVAPQFDSNSLIGVREFAESTEADTVLFHISASDTDGPSLSYHFLDTNSNYVQEQHVFHIDQSTGTVTLMEKVDYETDDSVYFLRIVVSDNDLDNPLSVATDITVQFQDVQDTPPSFGQTTYVSVDENVEIGTDVVRINAEDGDRTNKHSISFSILSNQLPETERVFDINETTGIASVSQPIDAESLPRQIPLTVVATEICGTNDCSSSTKQITININNLNDESPTFNHATYQASVDENSEVGTLITVQGGPICVADKDNANSQLSVEIIGGEEDITSAILFDPQSVTVTATSSKEVKLRVNNKAFFDFEEASSYADIPLRVSDGTNFGFATLSLTVNNENDLPPVFSNAEYEIEFPEDTEIGSTLTTMQATDGDVDASLSYSFCCTGNYAPLKISAGGVVTLTDPGFDFESRQQYSVQVKVRDGAFEATATLKVTVSDVNDNIPQFGQQEYFVTIPENEDFELQLQATDNDGTRPNSDFEYSIESASDGSWEISASGLLFLDAHLDREDISPGNVTIVVRVSDLGNPSLSSTAEVFLEVTDQNDNRPVFDQIPYQFAISENQTQGVTFGSVHANDDDYSEHFSTVLYKLQVNPSSRFAIDDSTGDLSLAADNSWIDLDENPSSYLLTVIAYNPLSEGTAVDVNITIVDVNNKPPQFDPDVYDVTIPEDTEVDSVILEVSGSDSDQNSHLVFTLNPSPNGQFSLDSPFEVEGNKLILKHPLDRESRQNYNLECLVEDVNAEVNAGWQVDSAVIALHVSDVNDNAPTLVSDATFAVSESRAPSNSIPVTNLQGDDKDLGVNGEIAFSMDANPKFRINPKGQIFQIGDLDYEQQSEYNLTVTLTDSPTDKNKSLSSIYTIVVLVLNDNDNNPVVEWDADTPVFVSEDAEEGTVVHQFVAVDADGDPELTFSLLKQHAQFAIHPNGSLYVLAALDRELKSQYEIVIEVLDSASRKGSVPVTVLVTDVNDNGPIFSQNQFTFQVQEDASIGGQVGVVQATDADEGVNGRITYTILNITGDSQEATSTALFSLDNETSVLLVDADLRNFIGQFDLFVEAEDSGGLKAFTKVIIIVQDVNNHAPVITSPVANAEFTVYENAIIGKIVLEVTASDADEGANSDLSYSLESSNPNMVVKFAMDGNNLVVEDQLDRETTNQYTLVIVVEDSGSPRLRDEVTVLINILDTADSLPQFDQPLVSFTVPENRADGFSVGTVEATDKDTSDDHPIVYSIISANTNEFFVINASTGEISTLTPLDRETDPLFELVVQASQHTDLVSPQFDTQEVRIVVQDVNDNNPQFSQLLYVTGVAVGVESDTEVIQLSASDVDTVDLGKLRYAIGSSTMRDIQPSDFSLVTDPFVIGRESGLVERQIEFPTSVSGYVDLIVYVFDSDETHNDSCNVIVYLLKQDQRLLIVIDDSLNDVLNMLRNEDSSCIATLSAIIGADVHVDKKAVHVNSDGSLDQSKTDLYIHAVEPNTHKVMNADDIVSLLDSNPESIAELWQKCKVIEVQTLTEDDQDDASLVVITAVLSSVAGFALLILFLAMIYYVCRQRKELKEVKKKSEDIISHGEGIDPIEAYMRKNRFHSPVPGTFAFHNSKVLNRRHGDGSGSPDVLSDFNGSNLTNMEHEMDTDSVFAGVMGADDRLPAGPKQFWNDNTFHNLFLDDPTNESKAPFAESQLVALELNFDDAIEDEENKPSPIGGIIQSF